MKDKKTIDISRIKSLSETARELLFKALEVSDKCDGGEKTKEYIKGLMQESNDKIYYILEEIEKNHEN